MKFVTSSNQINQLKQMLAQTNHMHKPPRQAVTWKVFSKSKRHSLLSKQRVLTTSRG